MVTDSREEISHEMRQRVHQLLDEQCLGVLATKDEDGHPYASLVAFAANPEKTEIYFVTPKATRKHANLVEDGRVALLINNSNNAPSDFHDAIAVTILGDAKTVGKRETPEFLKIYLRKHGYLQQFAHSPSCALFAVEITGFTMVQQFQNVSDLRFDQGLDTDA